MGNGDCSIYKKRYVTIIKKKTFMLVCFYTNENAFIIS